MCIKTATSVKDQINTLFSFLESKKAGIRCKITHYTDTSAKLL